MAHRTDDSFDAEEIVALRVELIRVKSKLQEREKIAERAQAYQEQLEALVGVLADRSSSVQQIAATLGIKADVERDYFGVRVKGGKEQERTVFGRISKVKHQLQIQDELLKAINQTVARLIKETEQSRFILDKLSKQHAQCADFGYANKEMLQKLKQMEKQIQQKDATIAQLNKNNHSLQQEIKLLRKKSQENTSQLQLLTKEFQVKSKEVQDGRQIIETAQEASKQKQRILDSCQKLLQTIIIPQEEYLKYYFRSNGLPLEPPRQQKNKYSILFDT